MFTGIVQGTAKVVKIDKKERFQTHVVELSDELCKGLEIGASVAHNGCCLTVTNINGNLISFDLMQATLALTNLGELVEGDSVNIERAAKFGDEIGGHSMSGHISLMADIVETAQNLLLPVMEAAVVLALGGGYQAYFKQDRDGVPVVHHHTVRDV